MATRLEKVIFGALQSGSRLQSNGKRDEAEKELRFTAS